jgi:hypothetical protein
MGAQPAWQAVWRLDRPGCIRARAHAADAGGTGTTTSAASVSPTRPLHFRQQVCKPRTRRVDPLKSEHDDRADKCGVVPRVAARTVKRIRYVRTRQAAQIRGSLPPSAEVAASASSRKEASGVAPQTSHTLSGMGTNDARHSSQIGTRAARVSSFWHSRQSAGNSRLTMASLPSAIRRPSQLPDVLRPTTQTRAYSWLREA